MDIANNPVRHGFRLANFALFLSCCVTIGWLVFRTETGRLDVGTQWALIGRAAGAMVMSMLLEALVLQPKPPMPSERRGAFPIFTDEQEQE
jgi:hypothetical protein